jgi:hypothetical protein
MLTRNEFINKHYGIDISGNDLESSIYTFERKTTKLITKTKPTEFEYHMDVLCPDWESVEMKQLFHIEKVDIDNPSLCICTQKITDVCYLQHPSLAHCIQVGNECVKKINFELSISSKLKLAKKRKEKKELEKQLERQRIMDLEIEEMRKRHEELRIERERNYRKCIDCHKFQIDIKEPEWNIRCKECYIKNKSSFKRLTF